MSEEKNPNVKLVVNNDKPESVKRELEGSTAVPTPKLTVVENDNNRFAGKGVVKLVRLITGEVVIGFWKPNGSYSCKVTDALLVHVQLGQNGALQLAMIEYMPYSKDNEFEFKMADVLNVVNPVESLHKSYISKVSGIIMPESGIVT